MEEGKLARAPTERQANWSTLTTRQTLVIGYSSWWDGEASSLISVSGTQKTVANRQKCSQ